MKIYINLSLCIFQWTVSHAQVIYSVLNMIFFHVTIGVYSTNATCKGIYYHAKVFHGKWNF